jgi:glycosyltransferase involved in cell wall biosynthesis
MSRRIKIIRIIARLNVGGPSIHVVNLNHGLDANRFASLLISGTENPGEGSMIDFALSMNIHPIIIPEIVGEASFKPRDLKALSKLYRLIKNEKPDIIHTHTAKAGFLGRIAGRLAGVPIIVHTYHGHVLHGYYSPIKTMVLRAMEKNLARITNSIIAVSSRVKSDLAEYGVAPADKISVIPLGFNLDHFLECEKYRGEFRSELGLANDAHLVGIVGRIFPIKNHRLFIEAASRLAVLEPTCRFIVVGDGAQRREMEQFAQQLGIGGRTHFTGWRRDLARIYADLDVLAVSSNNEGTPVSAIEAMASGCPVVGTRVGGMPDIIKDGENGYLVSPKNPDELASGLLRMIRDPQKAHQMGKAGRAFAREQFHIRRLISETENLYLRLLEKNNIASNVSSIS